MATDDFRPGPGTPKTPPGFRGVAIGVAAAAAPRGPVDLNGVFQIAAAEALAFGGQPHRALTVVVTSSDGAILGTPFREGGVLRRRPREIGRRRARLLSLPSGSAGPADPRGPALDLGVAGEHLSNVVELVGGRGSPAR